MADAGGYRSKYIGRQDVQGPAMERIAIAKDTNTAAKVDNEKWYAALLKYRALLDRIHERLLKD
jgi:hypothetical protein